MDGDVGNTLPQRSCEYCGTSIYEAALSCHQCKTNWEPCIISGYPLIKSQAISCKFCNMGAIRDYWNDFI